MKPLNEVIADQEKLIKEMESELEARKIILGILKKDWHRTQKKLQEEK